MKAEVLDAIKRSSAVPSMPQVVTRFLEITQHANFSYDELTTLLSTDPGTTSEVLRLSNSALFGVSRKITSLKQAMTLLGPRRVRSLVLGRYMVDAIGQKEMGDLDSTYYWRRSLAASVLAARFADILLPKMREEAFIAALLADIGITILAQEMSQPYAAVLKIYQPQGQGDMAQAETKALDITHAEVSAAILEHWQIPELICQAVSWHQRVLGEEEKSDWAQLARIIRSADMIAKLLCESPEMDRLAQDCEAALAYIHLELPVLAKILSKVEEDVVELGTLLRLDIIPGSIYKMIAQSIQERLQEVIEVGH